MSDKDQELYDEFGNYLNPVSDSEEESFELAPDSDNEVPPEQAVPPKEEEEEVELYEEKNYYSSLKETFPEADTRVQREDTMDIEDPILKAPKPQTLIVPSNVEKEDKTDLFRKDLQQNTGNFRNIAVVGGFHSGKTRFCDLLLNQQEENNSQPKKKRTDYFVLEQKRKLTQLLKPFSVLLEDSKGKSYVLNVLDTPGHPDFFDEVKVGLSMADGVIVIIDVIEGITEQLKEILKEIKFYENDIIVVFNKIDRLIVELKIPPKDAYFKLNQLTKELKVFLDIKPSDERFFFASTKYNILFNLDSFGKIYFKRLRLTNSNARRKALWGDIYYDSEDNKFIKHSKQERYKRTFVEFVLNPIYKVFSHSVSKDGKELKQFLSSFNLKIDSKLISELEFKHLLQGIFSSIFLKTNDFIDVIVNFVDTPLVHNKRILRKMGCFDVEADLLVYIPKLIPKIPDLDDIPEEFFGLCRVLKGTLTSNDSVYIIDGDQQETKNQFRTNKLNYVKLKNNLISTENLFSGNIGYISDINNNVHQRGFITDNPEITPLFRSLALGAAVKLGVEPVVPSELPSLHKGIQLLQKTFSGLRFVIEETGENILIGRGELFLDTINLYIRESFAKIELRVAEPTCLISETCSLTSQFFAKVDTHNKANSLSFLCEPIPLPLKNNFAFVKHSTKEMKVDFLKNELSWDNLDCQSVWAFGPLDQHPSLLLDHTIPFETDSTLLRQSKPVIMTGFSWASSSGPLCETPLHNTLFKLSKAEFHADPKHRSPGQLIPCVRRGLHSALLLAGPRLVEPYYTTEITTSQEALPTVYNLLSKRRGQLVEEKPLAGTPLFRVLARLPVLDSFGFETDLKTMTLGQAAVVNGFGGWEVMPGDPLDREVKLGLLEPAEPIGLARDVFIKTRRRKGLTDDISVLKYFDDKEIIEAMKKTN